MIYTRFGNFVANPRTNLSDRQSYAVETSTTLQPVRAVSMLTVLAVGIAVLYFWNRK
jgi:hypothetical protein